MAHAPGHMYMTSPRPSQPGDESKAATVLAAALKALAPYQDYHRALADGYRIFLPDVPQPQYHFTRYDYAREAWSRFDPLKPTSLLYTKTADGGYKLVGAMYTARVDASEAELNERIPLSIARWHQHINFCKAPAGQKAAYFGPDAKFGLLGSISTRAEQASNQIPSRCAVRVRQHDEPAHADQPSPCPSSNNTSLFDAIKQRTIVGTGLPRTLTQQ